MHEFTRVALSRQPASVLLLPPAASRKLKKFKLPRNFRCSFDSDTSSNNPSFDSDSEIDVKPHNDQEIQIREHSFDENDFVPKHTPCRSYTKRKEYFKQFFDNANKPVILPKLGDFETDFVKFQAHLENKMDPFELVVKDPTTFPFKVFDSDFLKQANQCFNFVPKYQPIIDSFVEQVEVKKAFLYIFWIYFGFRFQSSAFTHTDARPWQNRRAAENLKPIDQREELNNSVCQSNYDESGTKRQVPLKRKGHHMNEKQIDVALEGPEDERQHRISCIKAWRAKFQVLILNMLQVKDYVLRDKEQEKKRRRMRDVIYNALPFLFGQAIVLVFEKYIRHGEYLLRVFDPELSQLYQIIFMEIIGFRVDPSFIA